MRRGIAFEDCFYPKYDPQAQLFTPAYTDDELFELWRSSMRGAWNETDLMADFMCATRAEAREKIADFRRRYAAEFPE